MSPEISPERREAMILILSQNTALASTLVSELKRRNATFEFHDLNVHRRYERVYTPGLKAIVIDDDLRRIPTETLSELSGKAKDIPVILIDSASGKGKKPLPLKIPSDHITLLQEAAASQLLATLEACGVIPENPLAAEETVPLRFFTPHIGVRLLNENRALGLLCLDASGLKKVELENGHDAYLEVRGLFEKMFVDLCGKNGCLRKTDLLCRHPTMPNHYVVLLQPSRITGSLPLPGDTERIADRLATELQNQFWNVLCQPENRRKFPELASRIPLVSVGFASIVNNPVLEAMDLVSEALDASTRTIAVQLSRVKERIRELLQYLIHSPDLLTPFYQAVFKASAITKEDIEKAKQEGSMAPLSKHLFGFESLIRVPADRVGTIMKSRRLVVEPKLLFPDLLFALAKNTHIALELDQACFKKALWNSEKLPGALLINILPRNLYHFDRLLPDARKGTRLILEVSESEPLNNVDLVYQAAERTKDYVIDMAADDFGRDYAGLSRVIEMRPKIIKFDRNLVQEIQLSAPKQAYLKGVIIAAKQLNAEVVAEGVETYEELKMLQEMGVDYVQGFLLHRPQGVNEILKSLGLAAADPTPLAPPAKAA